MQLRELLGAKMRAPDVQSILRFAGWFCLYLFMIPAVSSAKALVAEESAADILLIIVESNNWLF